MSGIIVFKWVVASLFFLTCVRWANVQNGYVTAVIALGSIQLLDFYFIERPQFISFVCFGALLAILFRFFEHPADRSLWSILIPLSLLMLVWANMHGGFLIGLSILIFCIITEGIKFTHHSLSPLSQRSYKVLVLSSLAAITASFINPNAANMVKALPMFLDGNNYVSSMNLEYMSVIEYFKYYSSYTVIIFLASMLLTGSALLSSPHRKNITWVGLLAGTAVMGYQHIRLTPFFLVSAIFFMTRFFETEYVFIKGRLILMMMLAVTTCYCLSKEYPRFIYAVKSGWVPANHFPVKAADYLTTKNISGNLYTTDYWGGYMIWRVGPDQKFFFDGRALNIQRLWEYNNSKKIVADQRPYWKGLFRMYDIRVAVLPIYEANGELNTLTQSIFSDNEWVMSFADKDEVVLVRNK